MSDTPITDKRTEHIRDAYEDFLAAPGSAVDYVCDAETSRAIEVAAAALARDLEGACRRLAELGEPINSKPQSLVDWDKMKEGV